MSLRMKWLLSFALLLALLCCALPVEASAAPATSIRILNNDIRIPDVGRYTFGTYDEAKNVADKPSSYTYLVENTGSVIKLTLNNSSMMSTDDIHVIDINGDITIELMGDSSITTSMNNKCALRCQNGKATIFGNGTLTCNGADTVLSFDDLTIQSGTITTSSQDMIWSSSVDISSKLVMTGGKLDVTSLGSRVFDYGYMHVTEGIDLSGHAELSVSTNGTNTTAILSDGPINISGIARVTGAVTGTLETYLGFPIRAISGKGVAMKGGFLLAHCVKTQALDSNGVRNAIDLSGYKGYIVTASRNYDGSDPVIFHNTYEPSDEYLYLQVEPGPTVEPKPAPRTAPKTGDSANPAVWIVLLAVSGAGLCLFCALRLRKAKQKKNQ